jgi:hypothetical protein
VEDGDVREIVIESRNRWLLAAAAASAIVIVLLLLFRLPAPTVPLAPAVTAALPAAAVQLARPDNSDVVLRDEAELRDLRPLFLPTERNAALPEPRLEPGRTFLDSQTLRLTFTEAEAQISRDLPSVVMLDGKEVSAASPADALSPRENRLAISGIGRAEPKVEPFMPRGGFVEVTAMSDGGRVMSEPLPIEARPATEMPWAPLELIAVLDAAGLVSPLVVTDGSRVDEVDAHFRNYLVQEFRIGARLPPGFYRIAVSP